MTRLLLIDDYPDLVLLDINLPDLDGLEVLKRIMAIPAPPAVLMLTVFLIYNCIDTRYGSPNCDVVSLYSLSLCYLI